MGSSRCKNFKWRVKELYGKMINTLNEEYGSVQNYIVEELGITQDEIIKLQNMYLE